MKELVKETKNIYISFYFRFIQGRITQEGLITFGLWVLIFALVSEITKQPQNYNRIIVIVLLMISAKLSHLIILLKK